MLISFPNMGPNWVAFKTLFTTLGLDVVIPDPTNREAIKFGVKNSPEFICFPFKATIGDFVNAIEKGADTLIMAIDCGPCRFGFYASVQERILKDMGYKALWFIDREQEGKAGRFEVSKAVCVGINEEFESVRNMDSCR